MIFFEPSPASIFDSGAQALVNPVNCVGAMGRGLALEFKTRFPRSFASYKTACVESRGDPARLLGSLIAPTFENELWILNAPTKLHFKDNSKLIWIRSSCLAIEAFCRDNYISQCAIPAMGCGLGGLSWEQQIRPLFEEIFSDSEVNFLAYPPGPAPELSQRPRNRRGLNRP